jgi:NitT/TauT family transport system permease protein
VTATLGEERARSLTPEEEARLVAGDTDKDSRWRSVVRRWSPTVVTVAIAPLLVVFWLLARELDLVHPILLPEFTDALDGVREVVTADGFTTHLNRTLSEIGLGFLLGCVVGLGLGIGLSSFPTLRRAYFPLLAGFEAIPGIVLAPVVITWLGFGLSGKVVQAAIACFFPVFVTTLVGLSLVSDNELKLMRIMKASRWTVMRELRIRSALPAIFGGLKIAITMATIGAIVSEFVGSDAGLGYLLLRYKGGYDTPAMFALIFIFGVIGVLSFLVLEFLERRIVFWRKPS